MPIFLLLGTFLVFAAIFCLVMGLAARPESAMSARLATLRGDGPAIEFRAGPPRESITSRVFAPLAESMGKKAEHLLPTHWIQGIEQKLIQAGQPLTTTGFLFVSILAEGMTILFGLTLVVAAGSVSGKGLILVGIMAIFGLVLPKVWLSNRVRFRQKTILKSLPDAFDLITVCVEAGLGLEAALSRVSEKVQGPFAEELDLTLREVSLGKLRRDALRELAGRTGVADLTSFINAVIQAETMGTSIATVLRVQAEQMRTRRRQRAEQAAYQAPVKMIFPLVLCIFPTLFIVILGPAGISIYRQLVAK